MLISLDRVGVAFAKGPLFTDLTFSVQPGEKLALIGPNGSGKSTLLKLIAGEIEPDEGAIVRRRGVISRTVHQEDTFRPGATSQQIVLEALSSNEDLHERLLKVRRILESAGFTKLDEPAEQLSGGWRKRLSIVRALVVEPELLLLDEPTNHLDLEGILWLEEYIRSFPGTVIMVSHDRYLLERCATRVIEINRRFPSGFVSVPGTYSDFLEGRDAVLDNLRSQRDSLANKVRREVAWLRRGAKAQTSKSQARIQRAEEMIDSLAAFKLDDRRVDAEFAESARRTKELIVADGVSVALGGRQILQTLTCTVSPGMRIGVVGPNGSGKTTLLKVLLGEIAPTGGLLRRAPSLATAVFDQRRMRLDRGATVKRALAPDGDQVIFNGRAVHVAGWATRFLLQPQQLSTRVGDLSGGEQARVLVATMMAQPCDLLVLDEPTNDLDIETLEALEEALLEFAGAVVVVSHDRYLLEKVCTVVLGILPDGRVRRFADYLQWEAERSTMGKVAQGGSSSSIEEQITAMEKRIAASEARLSSPELQEDTDALMRETDELTRLHAELDALYEQWSAA